MGRVELEHRLDLRRSKRVDVGDARAGEVGDRLDESVTSDTFINRPAFRTELIREPGEHLFDRPPGQAFEVQRPQGLTDAVDARVVQEADQPRPGSPR